MGALAILPAIVLMTHVVVQDQSPLREACGPEERVGPPTSMAAAIRSPFSSR